MNNNTGVTSNVSWINPNPLPVPAKSDPNGERFKTAMKNVIEKINDGTITNDKVFTITVKTNQKEYKINFKKGKDNQSLEVFKDNVKIGNVDKEGTYTVIDNKKGGLNPGQQEREHSTMATHFVDHINNMCKMDGLSKIEQSQTFKATIRDKSYVLSKEGNNFRIQLESEKNKSSNSGLLISDKGEIQEFDGDLGCLSLLQIYKKQNQVLSSILKNSKSLLQDDKKSLKFDKPYLFNKIVMYKDEKGSIHFQKQKDYENSKLRGHTGMTLSNDGLSFEDVMKNEKKRNKFNSTCAVMLKKFQEEKPLTEVSSAPSPKTSKKSKVKSEHTPITKASNVKENEKLTKEQWKNVTTGLMEKLKKHLKKEGIFRIESKKTTIDEELKKIKKNGNVKDNNVDDPFLIANLIKRAVREVNPLGSQHEALDQIKLDELPKEDAIKKFREFIHSLNKEDREFLKSVLSFILEVAKHSDTNKMTVSNLCVVFAPNICDHEQQDQVAALSRANKFEFMIAHYSQIFAEPALIS